MANERQSRQQTSERAQTSSRNAQQGEWQPSTQRGGTAQQSSGSMTESHGQQQSRTGRGDYPSTRRNTALESGGYGVGPFSLMHRITDEMDRLFESFGMGRSAFPSPWGQSGLLSGAQSLFGRPMWTPSIDMCQRGDKLVVTADLPGIKKDDLDVRVENNYIVIQGHRHDETSSQEEGWQHRERSYGTFYRVIDMPEGADAEQANATFRDGVLKIEIPMSRQNRGRKLEIRDGGSSTGERSGTGSSYGDTTSGSTSGGA